MCQHINSLINPPPNIIAKSKNGSGKSLALCLLLLDALGILSDRVEDKDFKECNEEVEVQKIEGLVLAPTREIAIQLHEYYNLLVKGTSKGKEYQSSLLIGGLELKEQRKNLLVNRPKVIFATLGRLLEVIDKEYISFKKMKIAIVDEADKFKISQEQNYSKQQSHKISNWKDLAQVFKQLPTPQCRIAAFSATYTKITLKNLYSQLGNDAIFINATVNEDSDSVSQNG